VHGNRSNVLLPTCPTLLHDSAVSDSSESCDHCVAVIAETSVHGRVPESVQDDVLRVCWSPALETAAAEERFSAVVDR